MPALTCVPAKAAALKGAPKRMLVDVSSITRLDFPSCPSFFRLRTNDSASFMQSNNCKNCALTRSPCDEFFQLAKTTLASSQIHNLSGLPPAGSKYSSKSASVDRFEGKNALFGNRAHPILAALLMTELFRSPGLPTRMLKIFVNNAPLSHANQTRRGKAAETTGRHEPTR